MEVVIVAGGSVGRFEILHSEAQTPLKLRQFAHADRESTLVLLRPFGIAFSYGIVAARLGVWRKSTAWPARSFVPLDELV